MALLEDREWRLDHLYTILDEHGEAVTFSRNEAQRALWERLWYFNIILKARQRGISTFVALLMLDECLWNSNTHCGIIDATLGDATKKLDKIRFAYEQLAPEFKQLAPLKSDNATSLEWKNGSRIDVGTSHRGGTLQILHVSEMGKIAAESPKRAREIRTGAFGTVHKGSMVFVESTAKGAAGDFFDLVTKAKAAQDQGRELTEKEFRLLFLPWWSHETYRTDPTNVVIPKELSDYFDDLKHRFGVDLDDWQKAWYAVERSNLSSDPADMWSEHPSYADEAFKVSLEGAYFRTQMTKARQQGRIGRILFDPARPVHTCWDIGKNDNTSIWFFQEFGNQVHLIDYYENSNEGTAHYANYLKRVADENGYVYGKHYGPHDLDHTLWILPGREKIKDVAATFGINFIVVPRIPNKMDAIEAGRNWLSMCWIDEEKCARGIACLDAYRKEWDDKRGDWKSEPFHNWASHGADALMTGACGFTPDYIPPPSDRYARGAQTRRSAWAA